MFPLDPSHHHPMMTIVGIMRSWLVTIETGRRINDIVKRRRRRRRYCLFN
jgi:hypothetical protein